MKMDAIGALLDTSIMILRCGLTLKLQMTELTQYA